MLVVGGGTCCRKCWSPVLLNAQQKADPYNFINIASSYLYTGIAISQDGSEMLNKYRYIELNSEGFKIAFDCS